MVSSRQVRAVFFAAIASLFLTASATWAVAQDFSLTIPGGLHTPAVDPGGTSTATIDLEPVGAGGGAVTLSCAVTTTASTPTCLVSPSSAVPPATPALTITTSDSTPTGIYPIAITGSDSSGSETLNVTLTVTNLTADYSLSVSPTTATPSPIPAGASATSTVTVTPIGSYSGNVTLSCLSVTPIVVAAPFCSFQYPSGNTYVVVGGGVPSTVAMTITAFGPTPTTRRNTPRIYYALWLAVPGLALLGAGAGKNRKIRWLGPFLLIAIAGLLLLPACNNATNNNPVSNSPSGLTTPKNTYTFTLTGADQNGAAPSNATTGTGAATVALAVN